MLSQTSRLPCYAALSALALYVCTLGFGVTAISLPLVAKLAGWDATPMVGQPLLWLLTLPLQLLPVAWLPLAVKLFAAVLAAMIVGLLTRTVQLLPWDRPWESASRFAILLPVLVAGGVCGLEFSFWQEATSTAGELLDLLLLAMAAWLLLEFKERRKSQWLDAAAMVWGLGMAENWLMLMTLPLFIAGIIWVMRLRFFQWEIILRPTLLGLAGFSLYALLPMVNGLAPHSPWTLGHAWIASLHQTKSMVLLIYHHFWRSHRLATMVVVLCYLVPMLTLLVRMRDEGTRNKSGVDIFQTWIYRGLRAGLLLTCLWLAFDPAVGARQTVQRELGAWMPMLTFDYLNALGVAFLLGNLLLIPQPLTGRDDYRRSRTKFRWKQFAVPVVTAGFTLVVLGLAARNAPAIWRLNFHPIEEFGTLAVTSLPSGGGVMLGDFPDELHVFQAALAHSPVAAEWLAVDTHALPSVEYRAKLERRQPAGWLTDKNRHELTPLETIWLLQSVVQSNRLFYLHPSYGYFFERFYLEPTGTIYEMKLRGKDPLDVPAAPVAVADANEKFWTDIWNRNLSRLAPPPSRPGLVQAKLAHYGLTTPPRFQDRRLAEWFSVPLDGWAVYLQKQGRWHEAQVRFEQALQLNTNNLSVRISLACNTNLQAGARMGLSDVSKVADELGNASRLNMIINSGGPFDEPTVNYLLGISFQNLGLLVQAAEQFERVRTLTPGTLAPELALVEIYNRLQLTDRSRPLISHLRDESRKLPTSNSLDLNLALLESYSLLLQTNVASARNVLRSVVEQHPDDPQINSRVLAAYLAFGDLTNALRLANERLTKTPDDIAALNDKAFVLMQSGRGAEAVPLLDHALALTNQPLARLNRAFAYIAKEDFTLAESDLHELEKDTNTLPMVNFGFASIAQHNHDTNQAVHYLRLCLTNSPVGTPLWQQASARLRQLESAVMTK